jgi:hypothetical protein
VVQAARLHGLRGFAQKGTSLQQLANPARLAESKFVSFTHPDTPPNEFARIQWRDSKDKDWHSPSST